MSDIYALCRSIGHELCERQAAEVAYTRAKDRADNAIACVGDAAPTYSSRAAHARQALHEAHRQLLLGPRIRNYSKASLLSTEDIQSIDALVAELGIRRKESGALEGVGAERFSYDWKDERFALDCMYEGGTRLRLGERMWSFPVVFNSSKGRAACGKSAAWGGAFGGVIGLAGQSVEMGLGMGALLSATLVGVLQAGVLLFSSVDPYLRLGDELQRRADYVDWQLRTVRSNL